MHGPATSHANWLQAPKKANVGIPTKSKIIAALLCYIFRGVVLSNILSY